MPRKPVIQQPNLTYHVWTRCIEWRLMMAEEFFRALFVETIIQTQGKYHFELNMYEILDNHVHLIIRTLPGGAPISRIMQYLKSRFAEKYNKITGRIGPLWNERYKYSIIEHATDPVRYLLNLLWYHGYNAVRKGFVSDPRKYAYGGINAYLEKDYKSRVKITPHKFFLKLGETFEARLEAFLKYETAYLKRFADLIESI